MKRYGRGKKMYAEVITYEGENINRSRGHRSILRDQEVYYLQQTKIDTI